MENYVRPSDERNPEPAKPKVTIRVRLERSIRNCKLKKLWVACVYGLTHEKPRDENRRYVSRNEGDSDDRKKWINACEANLQKNCSGSGWKAKHEKEGAAREENERKGEEQRRLEKERGGGRERETKQGEKRKRKYMSCKGCTTV